MMHPATELRLINEQMGYGVFVTRFIPAGTVVFVKDALDLELSPDHPLIDHPAYRDTVEKYSYIEPNGVRVISWDNAKYVNHCCDPSTLTTGYGFEIAIRDLHPGDEITDDYSIFNSSIPMPLICEKTCCRGMVIPGDFDRHVEGWDARIRPAIDRYRDVEQPLETLIPEDILCELNAYLDGEGGYRSVATQRLDQPPFKPVVTISVNGNGHPVPAA